MKRALLLGNSDSGLQDIFKRSLEDRRATLDAIKDVEERREQIVKDYKDREMSLLKEIEARVKAIGITVFDAKNHEISFSPDEGVVWLETKTEGCRCPMCQLMSQLRGERQ